MVRHNLSGADLRVGLKTRSVSKAAQKTSGLFPKAGIEGQFTRRASENGGRSSGSRRSTERVSSSMCANAASILQQDISSNRSILLAASHRSRSVYGLDPIATLSQQGNCAIVSPN
jgi:hypothetical protein